MFDYLLRFFITAQRDETGASAVEYGLLLAGIAVVIGVAAATLGGQIGDLFTGILD